MLVGLGILGFWICSDIGAVSFGCALGVRVGRLVWRFFGSFGGFFNFIFSFSSFVLGFVLLREGRGCVVC